MYECNDVYIYIYILKCACVCVCTYVSTYSYMYVCASMPQYVSYPLEAAAPRIQNSCW